MTNELKNFLNANRELIVSEKFDEVWIQAALTPLTVKQELVYLFQDCGVPQIPTPLQRMNSRVSSIVVKILQEELKNVSTKCTTNTDYQIRVSPYYKKSKKADYYAGCKEFMFPFAQYGFGTKFDDNELNEALGRIKSRVAAELHEYLLHVTIDMYIVNPTERYYGQHTCIYVSLISPEEV